MGQCETCTQQLQYNAIDSDSLLQKISQLQLGKDIQKLRSDNQDYLSQYKFIIMPDRSMYKGKLVNSFKEGYGQLNSQQFNFYGFFREDKPSGIGAIVMEKKCIYGQFWNGVLEGRGKQWNQQYRFEGIFKKGERTEGTLIRDKDQLTYSGELKDNLYHGKGKLTTKVGACYQGDFIEGVFDGKGIFTFSNGNKYNGTFSKGKYHRYGEFAWTSGNYYKGQYCQGKRQGFGILMLDNVEYSGTWKNDVREGHGILSKQGDQVFGEWKQNHMIQS